MEVLREEPGNTPSAIWIASVSILVLMEVLREGYAVAHLKTGWSTVSILVLMEVLREDENSKQKDRRENRFQSLF